MRPAGAGLAGPLPPPPLARQGRPRRTKTPIRLSQDRRGSRRARGLCGPSAGADARLRVLDEVRCCVRSGQVLLREPRGVGCGRGRGRRVDRVEVGPPEVRQGLEGWSARAASAISRGSTFVSSRARRLTISPWRESASDNQPTLSFDPATRRKYAPRATRRRPGQSGGRPSSRC
jgi:hypothetical protein